MNNGPRLSVIIVNFETPDHTIEGVRSIFAFPPSCGFEVIVVDNGSRDGSLDVIRQACPEAACIETGRNLGFGTANNLGIHNARGEYVLLLNSDAHLLEPALDRMMRALDAEPAVGAVGPRLENADGRLEWSWGYFPSLLREVIRKMAHRGLSLGDPRAVRYVEMQCVASKQADWITAACFMAPRRVLLEAGLFDEGFFMYFEDIDLCRRIQQKGYKVLYEPAVRALHHGGVSASKNRLRAQVEYRRSQIHFSRKHFGPAGALAVKKLLLFKHLIYFVRGGLAYALLRGRARTSVYTKLLLSKKTIEMVFGKRSISEPHPVRPPRSLRRFLPRIDWTPIRSFFLLVCAVLAFGALALLAFASP